MPAPSCRCTLSTALGDDAVVAERQDRGRTRAARRRRSAARRSTGDTVAYGRIWSAMLPVFRALPRNFGQGLEASGWEPAKAEKSRCWR